MYQYETDSDDDDTRNARVRVIRHPGIFPMRPNRPMYPAPQPVYASYPAYAPAPMIVQRPARRIADLPLGEVAHLASQAIAALQSLPAAPAPVGATETDIANLITYQQALATHAKRDEQLRTIGALLAKFLA